MTNVQISVRFGRKSGVNAAVKAAGAIMLVDDFANEIGTGWFDGTHGKSFVLFVAAINPGVRQLSNGMASAALTRQWQRHIRYLTPQLQNAAKPGRPRPETPRGRGG
jgi:hypothetical protein